MSLVRIDANGNVYCTPPDRAFLIYCARVHLAEASRRRHHSISRDFYWSLLGWAARCRREAMRTQCAPLQRGLFGEGA